jgi:hypothetical protein
MINQNQTGEISSNVVKKILFVNDDYWHGITWTIEIENNYKIWRTLCFGAL